MKFTKAVLATLMLAMTTGSAQAARSATATLTINVTPVQSSCNITIPSLYGLGILKRGEIQRHGDLKITWECEGNTPVKTALTADIVKGYREGDSDVFLVAGDGKKSDVKLYLWHWDSGAKIKLTGPGAKDYFCNDASAVANTMRTCKVTPYTIVGSGAELGQTPSATLRFEVEYP
ncbi:F18 fimbrial protein FedE [Citrobacter freundii]|nr:F18 fimbrial protein FedE [Citrobacter freundii]